MPGWIVATMVLSSAYRNTDENMDKTQMIHLMPFKFLTGSSASTCAVELFGVAPTFSSEAWVVSTAAGSDDCSELVAFVSLSKFFSEAKASWCF